MSLRRKIMAAVILLVFIPVIAMGAVTYLIYAEKARQQLDDLRRISLQKDSETCGRCRMSLPECPIRWSPNRLFSGC